METTQDYVMVSLKLLGALGLLIYGMKMMSEALQKVAGPQLRHILAKMTKNRLTGVLTGTIVTSAVPRLDEQPAVLEFVEQMESGSPATGGYFRSRHIGYKG